MAQRLYEHAHTTGHTSTTFDQALAKANEVAERVDQKRKLGIYKK